VAWWVQFLKGPMVWPGSSLFCADAFSSEGKPSS